MLPVLHPTQGHLNSGLQLSGLNVTHDPESPAIRASGCGKVRDAAAEDMYGRMFQPVIAAYPADVRLIQQRLSIFCQTFYKCGQGDPYFFLWTIPK